MGVCPGRGVSHTPFKCPNGGEFRYIHSALAARKRGRMRYAPTLPSDRSHWHACAPQMIHGSSRRRRGAPVGYSDSSPCEQVAPAGNHLMSALRPVASVVVSNRSRLCSAALTVVSNKSVFLLRRLRRTFQRGVFLLRRPRPDIFAQLPAAHGPFPIFSCSFPPPYLCPQLTHSLKAL